MTHSQDTLITRYASEVLSAISNIQGIVHLTTPFITGMRSAWSVFHPDTLAEFHALIWT
ncbi:MAG: hypothetical protein HY273_12430 [Gammaproteobacteria bacterium]|nr:hypothetical protein [Gammaproteobacteria bacterium]